jgi:uncharacterized coiled-coil protein SlyX
MASLYTKTKLFLEANSKTWDDTKVSLQNNSDGNGDFIASWSYDGLAKPTDEQIASYETAGNTQETLNGVLAKREREYKQLKEQLDLLYHDMVADKGDKTGEWFKHIKAVKDANPKS